MKLEVGMYVRLQNDAENIVIINRIANVFETTILTENDGSIYQGEYTKENVIKADYKIIKILEIGDHVNGCKVIKNTLKDGGNIVIVQGGNCFTNEEIKSIVTKEQMEQMAYKVGE
jgi:hypothetical protein